MNQLRALWMLSFVVLSACGGEQADTEEVGETTEALAPAGSDARFVGTTLPPTLAPGERRRIQVTMQNTGVSSPANDWTTSNPAYALSGQPYAWRWSYVYPPSVVPVGASTTFSFVVTAPYTSSPFQAQMSANGLGLFGDRVSIPVTIDAGVTPQWGCTFVPGSSTVPATLAPGEARGMTVTVRNTGSATWPASGLKLVSEDTPVNLWRQTVVDLKTAVPPGSTASFWVRIDAPVTPGTYPFQREMKDYSAGGVGDFRVSEHCVNLSIAVNDVPPLAATLSSQTFPLQMAPAETRAVTVRMTNTGTKDWTAGGSYVLSSVNSPVNLWSTTLEEVSVATPVGASADFTFLVTAPPTPGTYRQRWQMRKLDGADADYFGEILDVPVTVNASVMAQYGAKLVSQTIPASMSAGESYPISITLQNSGSATWSTGVYLDSTNSPANLWGITILPLASGETVAPGASRTFDFTVHAPSAPGTYGFSWRMSSNAVGRFGDAVARTLVVGSASCDLDAFPKGTYELEVVTTDCISYWSDPKWLCAAPTTEPIRLILAPLRYPIPGPGCPSNDPACWAEDLNSFSITLEPAPVVPVYFSTYVADRTVSIHVQEANFECMGWPFPTCWQTPDSITFDIDRTTGAVTNFNYSYFKSSLGPDGYDHSVVVGGTGSLMCSAASAGLVALR